MLCCDGEQKVVAAQRWSVEVDGRVSKAGPSRLLQAAVVFIVDRSVTRGIPR